MIQKIVLHIDDDSDDRFFVSSALTQVSNTLVFKEAENGGEGIKYLEECKANNHLPCLVLLDMNMPKMNGLETLKKLKTDPILSKIPIVLFTTTLPQSEAGNIDSMGFKMVCKPAGYHEFVSCLHEILNDFQISH